MYLTTFYNGAKLYSVITLAQGYEQVIPGYYAALPPTVTLTHNLIISCLSMDHCFKMELSN